MTDVSHWPAAALQELEDRERERDALRRKLAQAQRDTEAVAYGRNAALKREIKARELLARWEERYITACPPSAVGLMNDTRAFLEATTEGLQYIGPGECNCNQGDDEWVAHWHGKDCPARTSATGKCGCETCSARATELGAAWTGQEPVPSEVHERGWQWRPVTEDTAFAPPFGTIRVCRGCGCLVAGGPTACRKCAAGFEQL